MTDVIVTVKVKPSRKTLDKADILGWIDRKAASILQECAWLNCDGEPVIPNVLDETYLQALHDVRQAIQTGNFAA